MSALPTPRTYIYKHASYVPIDADVRDAATWVLPTLLAEEVGVTPDSERLVIAGGSASTLPWSTEASRTLQQGATSLFYQFHRYHCEQAKLPLTSPNLA